MLDHRDVGLERHWNIETLKYRDVGLKKCWIIEMLDYRSVELYKMSHCIKCSIMDMSDYGVAGRWIIKVPPGTRYTVPIVDFQPPQGTACTVGKRKKKLPRTHTDAAPLV